jgi:hypothetical protein
MIHQLEHKRTHKLYNPSDEELDEFYRNGTIELLKQYKISSWSFWRVNFDKKYIKVLLAKDG